MDLKRGEDEGSSQITYPYGKKAISPLIATVLLIAFAVSIGTMIMNWGINQPKAIGDCQDVKMELQTINSKPALCYDTINSKLILILKNTGDIDINKIKLVVTTSDLQSDQQIIPNSEVKSGSISTIMFDYVKAGTFKVEVIPVVTNAGKEKSCLDKEIIEENLIKCGDLT